MYVFHCRTSCRPGRTNRNTPRVCVDDGETFCFSITTSSESPTCLYTRNTRKRYAGHLATSLSAHRLGRRHQVIICRAPPTTPLQHLSLSSVNRVSQAHLLLYSESADETPPRGQSFPIRSWVDLPHICDSSPCRAFHFQVYQNCF